LEKSCKCYKSIESNNQTRIDGLLLVFRRPKSTDDGVGDGRSDVELGGGLGGGGDDGPPVASASSPPDVGLTHIPGQVSQRSLIAQGFVVDYKAHYQIYHFHYQNIKGSKNSTNQKKER
jgi:hypothetical protein